MSRSKSSQHLEEKHMTEEKEYIFKRDFRSSMRLNFNHYLMREVVGYLTHPDLPITRPDLRVADIGTGTGIWACELATKLDKSARVDAFDISDAQYPAPAFRPETVHFYVHNGFEDYPAEFQGQYDIVHARFLMCSVDDSNVGLLLRGFLSLVKPGGHLQWFEPLPRSTKVVSSGPDTPNAASERLVQIWHKLDPLGKYSWVEDLKGLCERAGLEDVSQWRHGMPNHLRPLWAQSSLASTADVLPEVDMWSTTEGGLTAKFIEDLQQEIARGVAVDTPFQCVIGRKPDVAGSSMS
ncbi:MAG: hypothetical protein Q9172_006634 [Xanthocarpia lactea]